MLYAESKNRCIYIHISERVRVYLGIRRDGRKKQDKQTRRIGNANKTVRIQSQHV